MPLTLTWTIAALEAARHRQSRPAAAHLTMPRRLGGDAGEGVISAAIAVLIRAFLGALMWFGFQRMWQTTEQETNDRVSQIGADAP
ncbi:MAG: hypothetical protein R2690_13220 [Acidimicrobiales bacterium]